MYKTIDFFEMGSTYNTFYAFEKWLAKIQKTHVIEIVSVTSIENRLVVVYREISTRII